MINWNKISNISLCGGGAIAILDQFVFRPHWPGHPLFFMITVGSGLAIFIFSEIMKVIVRALWIIDDAFLKDKIPRDIVGYFLFLSIGLYVGFHSCLDEFKRDQSKNQHE